MVLRAEPGKQKPRSCRTQELARSSAQEKERRKKGSPTERRNYGLGRAQASAGKAKATGKSRSRLFHAGRSWASGSITSEP